MRFLAIAATAAALCFLPIAAHAVCYDVQGQMGVWADYPGTLANFGMVEGTPVFGRVEFDTSGTGTVQLAAGTATFGATVNVNVANDTLYLWSFSWSFPSPYADTYGDVRFEGPTGWLAGGIPGDLDDATYGWGYFSFSNPAPWDYAEFWIYLPTFNKVSCAS